MPKWFDITRSEKFQTLPKEEQTVVKQRFFERFMLPDLEQDEELNSPEVKQAIFQKFMMSPDDTGQGYVTSMLGSAGRGFGEMIPGAVEGVGALTGSQGIREFGQDIRSGLESISPVNPLYAESIPVKMAGVGGQALSVLATAGAGGAAGKALGGVGAATKGMQAAPLASAFLQGAAGGAREAEQYGMAGPEAYLKTLSGGALEAGTELLPFGMAAETALARRMFAGAPKTTTLAGAMASEAGEESLGQIGSNIATQALAPIGVETPGITEGALEAGAYGAFGGSVIGGINALIPTAPEKQTREQQQWQAEINATPVDVSPNITPEESQKNAAEGGIPVVTPDGVVSWMPAMRSAMTAPTEQAPAEPSVTEQRLRSLTDPAIQVASEALNATANVPFTDISGQAAAAAVAQNAELSMQPAIQSLQTAEETAPEVISQPQPLETQENAIQEQIPDEGVLRQERPEMGLQGVVEQNVQPEEVAGESVQEEVTNEPLEDQIPSSLPSVAEVEAVSDQLRQAPEQGPLYGKPSKLTDKDRGQAVSLAKTLQPGDVVETNDGQETSRYKVVVEDGTRSLRKIDQRGDIIEGVREKFLANPARTSSQGELAAIPDGRDTIDVIARSRIIRSGTEAQPAVQPAVETDASGMPKLDPQAADFDKQIKFRAIRMAMGMTFDPQTGKWTHPSGRDDMELLFSQRPPKEQVESVANALKSEYSQPQAVATERDATKPAQMTPEEFEKVKNSLNVKRTIAQSKLADAKAIHPSKNPAVQIKQIAKQRARRQELDDAERAFEEFYPTMAFAVEDAIKNRQPFSTSAHKEIGMDYIPSGYTRQGDLYIFQPQTISDVIKGNNFPDELGQTTEFSLTSQPQTTAAKSLVNQLNEAKSRQEAQAILESATAQQVKEAAQEMGYPATGSKKAVVSRLVAAVGSRADAKAIRQQSPQTTAAEKPTPESVAVDSGAAGVVQSEPSRGSILEVEKESAKTAIESTEKSLESGYGTVVKASRDLLRVLGNKNLNAQTAIESRLHKLSVKELQDAFELVTGTPTKLTDRTQLRNNVLNALLEERIKPQIEAADKTFASAEREAEEELQRAESIARLFDKERKNPVKGQVSNADVQQAAGIVGNNGTVPSAPFTWMGNAADLLAMRNTPFARAFPGAMVAATVPNVEGVYENGMAFVFTDQVVITDLDRRKAAEDNVSPSVAAAMRVITHENYHKGLALLPAKQQADIMAFLRSMFPADELDALARSYRQYADWRTNAAHEMALLDERLQKYIEETKTIPTDGVWKQFWDYIKAIWRKWTGKPQGEPTLQSMKDVVRLIRKALKDAYKQRPDQTKGGDGVLMSYAGGPQFVQAVNLNGRIETGTTHYDAWIKHVLRQLPAYQKDGLSERERFELADKWLVAHPEFLSNSVGKEGFMTPEGFLNRQEAFKKFRGMGGIPQLTPGEQRDWLDSSDIEDARFSISYASEASQASSLGQQTARGITASPRKLEAIIGVRQAYESMPKIHGNAVSLAELFDAAAKIVPNLTQVEFNSVVQGMYEDNAALLDNAETPSSIVILPNGAMMSVAGGSNDAEYLAAVESGDMEKAQRMVDEAAKRAGFTEEVFKAWVNYTGGEYTNGRGEVIGEDPKEPIRVIKRQSPFPTFDSAEPPYPGIAGFFAKDKEVARRFLKISTDAVLDRFYVDPSTRSVIDAGGKPAGVIQFGATGKPFRDLVRSGEFDSIQINNTLDEGDVVVLLNSNKVKSADPVTYDDAGNVIPLSQRFQPSSPDIRFSIASTPEQQSAAAKFKSAITAAAQGLPDLREYEGRRVKDKEGDEIEVEPHNVLWFNGFMNASEQLIADLQTEGLSLDEIYSKVTNPQFQQELGLFSPEAGQGQAAVVLAGNIMQRTLNASRKAKTKLDKFKQDALHLKAAEFYYGLGTKAGQNLLLFQLLQNDPRTRFIFMENRALADMLKKADHGVNLRFDGAYGTTQEATDTNVNASATAATKNIADQAEEAEEDDQDAIDLAEGEATLTGKLRELYEQLKDLLRENGILARLDKEEQDIGAKMSISPERRSELAKLTKEERAKLRQKNEAKIEEILKAILGEESDAKTPEQKSTRKKREKMAQTAQKRAQKGKEIEVTPTSLGKIINQARRDIKGASGKPIQWREIFRQPAKSVEEFRKNILLAIMGNDAFKDMDEAQKRQISDMFAEAWGKEREKVLNQLQKRHENNLEAQGKREAAKALREARNQILEIANLGVFSNDELTRILGEKFGFKTSFTEAEQQKLSELAEKIQDESLSKPVRNKLAREFLATLQSGTQISIAELLSNWWVASVLSGGNTITAIALSFTNGTGIGILGTHVSRAIRDMVKGDTAGAIEAITSMFKAYAKHIASFPSAANRAWNYLWTGDVSLLEASANDPFKNVRSLADIARYQIVADQVAKDPNKVKAVMGRFMQFMGRLLSALDAFNVMITKAGTTSLAIRQSGLTADQIRDAELKNDLKFYKDKIIREDPYFNGKAPANSFDKAYLDSLAEAALYKDLADFGVKMENADYLAAEAAMTMTPTGVGGIVYNKIKALDKDITTETRERLKQAEKAWAAEKDIDTGLKLFTWRALNFLAEQGINALGLRFARFAGNKFNQSLSYIPFLGALRVFETGNKELAGREEAFKDTIIRNQTIGFIMIIAGMKIIEAIADEPDDKKRGWFINGGWNNLTPDQKKQRLSLGEKQYTIGIGDQVFNYQNWPIGQAIAAIGELSDMIRFSPEKWKEKTTPGKFGSSLVSGMTSALEIPALTQVGEIFGNTMAAKDPSEQTISRLSRVMAGWAGGFMPRFLKDIDYMLKPEMRKYESFYEKAASHIPIYRSYVGKEYYDILGNQIKKNAIPGSRDFDRLAQEPEYKMLGALNARGIWLTPANAEYRMIGKGRYRRRLTQEEADRYSLETGKLYKQMIMRFGPRALQMPVEQAKDYISAKADDMRDLALLKAVR